MSEIKNRDYILEAIDQLRRRKARPDIQRICNFLTRKFSIDSKDTKSDLQRCVEKEIVYKVEYKGSISYRNAAKKSYGTIKRDHLPGEQTIVKTDARVFANIVITAMADLILGEPDYLEFGVPSVELIKKILTKHSSKYNKKMLTELLQKEVDNGGLIRMENGNFSLGPSSRNDDSEKSEMEDEYISVNTSDEISPPPVKIKKKPGPKPGKKKQDLEKLKNIEGQIGVRQGIRRKRAKKVFDPSDNMLPRTNRKRGRPLGSLNKSTLERQASLSARTSIPDTSPTASSESSIGHRIPVVTYKPASGSAIREGGVCSVCHLQGKKGGSERMVSCRECSNKAHYECLNTEDGMLRMHPDNTWQCPHCKTCVVCYETMRSDAGSLTVCSVCADAYHAHCHKPSITEKSKGTFQWICNNCQIEPNRDALLTENIESKIRRTDSMEKAFSDKLSQDNFSSGVIEQSTPTPPNSGRSSPFSRSAPPSPTPPTLSPQANHNGESQSTCSTDYKFNLSDEYEGDEHYDPSIPDASNWSYDDVYNYFAQYFPDEAIVFKEQEIDGHSLLLMKRVDVLTSLNLKLGPALKIYRHVVKLQVRKDDRKLYWL